MSNVLNSIKNGKKLIKRYFLVDYENVQSHGLVGLSKLTAGDAVTVYFSKNADTISFELHMAFNECKAKIDFQKVETGVKNALDFQLSSELGYIINKNIVAGNKDVKYYIVSMDNGFSVLCDFWKRFSADVSIVRCIDYVFNPPTRGDYTAAFEKLSLSENEERITVSCISNSADTAELHNNLQIRLRNPARATEIYREVKQVFIDGGELDTKIKQ